MDDVNSVATDMQRMRSQGKMTLTNIRSVQPTLYRVPLFRVEFDSLTDIYVSASVMRASKKKKQFLTVTSSIYACQPRGLQYRNKFH